jgi:hypothetical protein
VDGAGNAYVAGNTTSIDFPLANPFQGTFGGVTDAFVTKFNASGSLAYSTYLGGSGLDSGAGIAVDGAGNAYVTGPTYSTDFPLANPFQGTLGGGGSDAFVTKFNASGSALVYSTYLGGSGLDSGRVIAVDGAGNAYVAGSANSTNFPLANPFQGTLRGVTDAFVARIGDDPPTEPIRVVLSRDGSGQLVATITITNPLTQPVPGVQMTLVRASTLDGSAFVDGVPVPQFLGTINPRQSVTAAVTFPGTAGVPSGFAGLVRVELSFPGGTYTETKNVTTP